MEMTNLDKTLKEIKERAEAATDGWHHTRVYGGKEVLHYPDGRQIAAFKSAADPIFIAHARTDVPMLLEMVDVFFKWANNCFCDDDFVCYPCGFKKELEKIAERYSK